MIKQLPREVYDLIAAGEVVTSPLSVVKELVENALDADAKRITVELLSGGIERIRVSDNGAGITAGEIPLAFMPHATSKISSADDLYNTSTLGFRGEALASIAAVAKVTLLTRTADADTGSRATVSPGEALSIEPHGCDNGTDITIEHLFDNIPARKKHLRSARTETTKITDYLSRIAVFRADVSFRYLADSILIFTTRGQGDMLSAIQTVYGSITAQNLIEIDHEDSSGDISVSGYISNSLGLRKTRKGQVFFVNGRPVRNAVLENALSDAYKEFAEPGRFPAVFIFLEVPKNEVDVNIHPAKEEIALANSGSVQRYVHDLIRNILVSEKSIPKLRFRDTQAGANHYFDLDKNEVMSNNGNEEVSDLLVSTYGGDEKHLKTVDINQLLKTNNDNNPPIMQDNDNNSIIINDKILSTNVTGQHQMNISSLHVLANLFASYLLADDGDNMYLIDQHAAHERINFEKFMNVSRDKEVKLVQELMVPYLFTPPPGAIVFLINTPEFFSDLGFEIEEFGEGVWRATTFPAFLKFSEGEAFLSELLLAVAEGDIHSNIPENTVKTDRIIMRACRASIKAGDILSDVEISRLLNDLQLCDNPYTCPHGRPVFLKLSKSDIERLFKRAGAPG